MRHVSVLKDGRLRGELVNVGRMNGARARAGNRVRAQLVWKKDNQVGFARKFGWLRSNAGGQSNAGRAERGGANKTTTREFRLQGSQTLDSLHDLQSAFTANPDAANGRPKLLPARAGNQSIEPRFATIGGIAMNDAALGCFIESGNQAANLFGVRFGRAANAFLQRAQTRPHATVLVSALERLSGTFRCGFGIGHGLLPKIYRAWTLAQPDKMSRCRS